ncbi:uncharacterized protein L969DRAFT_481556 [Mixia osmundae IAM 14324]|uniref:Peptidase A1 domain-containing protein n=1 Tax=Mixia osmundae (strain CBS 9802 / IAM 14324 / JCM 22182 / KY 12970) TaxID=764103 RepID=G7E1C3_MIXOS|nr:uncharacterized protein L969DRAFT_481556 [Mixia osmundae IAM 14324]KEI38729.1 hypothetical protein L969DRAFT_481556 [Mixia osmundae IAM 14324]GAA96633.1 hypothetical protein E5Q_03303 [Mixia osmundae IAM 14324]
MLFKTLVGFVLALYSCNATITLPVKRVSLDSTSSIATKVARRNAHLGFTTHVKVTTNAAWLVEIGIGNPAHPVNFQIDSGSALTLTGIEHGYRHTKTTKNTSVAFDENFGDQSDVKGFLVQDRFSLSHGVPFKAYLGAAFKNDFFVAAEPGRSGVLALGNRAMFDQTLSNQSNTIPTFTESLQHAKLIEEKIVTLNLREPASIHFGTADWSKSKGPIAYMPRKNIGPTSYWACDVYMPSLGVTAKRNQNATSMIDSGTELTFLARAPLLVYYEKIKEIGGVYNASTDFFQFPKGAIPPAIDITIGETLLPLPGKAQLLADRLKVPNGLDPSLDYSVILPAQDGAETSLIGATLLSHYSIVFDSERDRIGFSLRA